MQNSVGGGLMRKVLCGLVVVFLFMLFCPSEALVVRASSDTRYEDMKDKASSVYDSMKEHAEDLAKDEMISEGRYGERLYIWFYDIYVAIKDVSIFIGGFSILIGAFLCFLVRHNKYLFRKIFVWLILGVPFLLVCFCFGIGAFIG